MLKKYYTPACEQDDLISIGTIGLIKGVSTYKPEKKVRLATYVSRCIENEILMHFRSLRKTASDVSLSESIDTDKEGNNLSLMDILSSPDDMLENISARETRAHLTKYIKEELNEREMQVITLRYGLNNKKPLTQREIAQKCDISRSYVSRIEKKAIEKLRRRFEDL